ncbi:MAG: hypothetical protein PWQ46_1259, partial [Methanomicrobiaceae archaeon]|nr:hypothetical protein [Methanomicrobiaceae archaeon]
QVYTSCWVNDNRILKRNISIAGRKGGSAFIPIVNGRDFPLRPLHPRKLNHLREKSFVDNSRSRESRQLMAIGMVKPRQGWKRGIQRGFRENGTIAGDVSPPPHHSRLIRRLSFIDPLQVIASRKNPATPRHRYNGGIKAVCGNTEPRGSVARGEVHQTEAQPERIGFAAPS